MGRVRLEAAIAWIAWVRGALEADFPQLVGSVASQAVVPLGGGAAQWIGAALAVHAGHRLVVEWLDGILGALEEVERQLGFALSELSVAELSEEAA